MAPEIVRRTRPRQSECYACTEHNYDWFANDLEEPYTTPEGKPFSWQGRMRITGGRTNVWAPPELPLQRPRFQGRVLRRLGRRLAARLRRSRARTTICVEDYVGISGQAEGVYELPDGRFLPPMPLTCPETRAARPRQERPWPDGHDRPQRQHHAAAPRPGGVPLLRSVRTRLRDALVLQRRVHDRRRRPRNRPLHPRPERDGLPDPDGRGPKPRHRRRSTSTASRARFATCPARVVILCAQALESARILFNSASRQHPAGLANSSGVLGHYLQDHVWNGGGARGDFADVPGTPKLTRAARPNGFYVIRFRNTRKGPRHGAFLRGYGMQGGWGDALRFNWQAPGYGRRVQAVAPRRDHHHEHRRFRRVSVPLGELRGDRSGHRRHLRHPRSPDPHGVE